VTDDDGVIQDPQFCTIAREEYFDLCPDKEQIFIDIARNQLGCGEEDIRRITPLSSKYSSFLLEHPVNEESCMTPRVTILWVVCKAWEYYKDRGSKIDPAFKQAWEDVQKMCAQEGLDV